MAAWDFYFLQPENYYKFIDLGEILVEFYLIVAAENSEWPTAMSGNDEEYQSDWWARGQQQLHSARITQVLGNKNISVKTPEVYKLFWRRVIALKVIYDSGSRRRQVSVLSYSRAPSQESSFKLEHWPCNSCDTMFAVFFSLPTIHFTLCVKKIA